MTLPIEAIQKDLLNHLDTHPLLLIQAPPGSGKTSRIPLWLLDHYPKQKILLVQPRRLAVLNAARMLATNLRQTPGQTVGYRMRHESKISNTSRLEIVTEGVFIRLIQDDPELTNVAAVILDEFHERHLNTDLSLALLRSCQQLYRPDLKLLLMSATLDGEQLSTQLNAPCLSAQGQSFPIETRYLPKSNPDPIKALEVTVRQSLANDPGNLLVFLPGMKEIRQLHQRLQDLPTDIDLQTLHGSTDLQAQKAVLTPTQDGRRKVVLSSPVAESSVTLPDIRVVIDSGLARFPHYDRHTGLSRLVTGKISQASAEQRRGRAGRTAPGICYRMWTEELHGRLAPKTAPEISNADYSTLLMELALWGTSVLELEWLDRPNQASIDHSETLLQEMQALTDTNQLTPLGQQMVTLGCAPRLAHMLILARNQSDDDANLACALAGLLQESQLPSGDLSHHLSTLLQKPSLNRMVQQCWQQFRRQLKVHSDTLPLERASHWLSLAYPDRIARQDTNGKLKLANGKSGRFRQDTHVPWMVVLDAHDQPDGWLIQSWMAANPPTPTDFPTMFFQQPTLVVEQGKFRFLVEQRFGQIRLEQTQRAVTDDEREAAILHYVRQQGLECLPWQAKHQQWRIRLTVATRLAPESNWPEFGGDLDTWLLRQLEQWLLPYLNGVRQLDQIPLQQALPTVLDWIQQKNLDALLPTHISINGRARSLTYHPDGKVTLAIKLQEMFGTVTTPTVCNGRLPITLELLSPAGRPLQITQDLDHFWRRGYPEVQKEMKGRYPKHPWPDDPIKAQPTAGTKRKSKAP